MFVKNKKVGTDEHLMTCSHPASSNYPSRAGSEIRTFMQGVGPGRIRTYKALARPIASVLYLETGEILIERITQRQACVGLSDQYLNQLVCCV